MSEMNIDTAIFNAVRDGVREGVAKKLTGGYNSPLDKAVNAALEKYMAPFQTMLEESIASCVDDEKFRKQIAVAVREAMAKTLIRRFGGEVEKQVNALKSNPTTRARITLAIEEIVKSSET